ncbi:MAG: VTT domain-containing protein [Verrucomicrobiota bacterium]
MFETLVSFGLLGVFAIATLERVLPVVPSYVLFALIGVMAAEQGGFAANLMVAILGSFFGGTLLYSLGYLVPPDRSTSIAIWVGRSMGGKPESIQKWLGRIERKGATLVGITQIVPTIRLLSPFFAGFFRARFLSVSLALALGTSVWVSLLVSAAWIGALYMPDSNPLSITLWVTFALLTVEVLAGIIWYLARKVLE